MHIMPYNFLYDPPQPLSISIKLNQRIAFRYSFNINIVNMRHTTLFDTPLSHIYHLCTALNPIVRFLCHITSYTTPLASFNFVQTSSPYCFNKYLHNKHSEYEAHDLIRYTPAPYIPPKANIIPFLMPYNFLYDPLSLFQFRSIFRNELILHIAST